ncbi:type II toxin-antitoxin system antitoxin VapB [Alpinimonas psychrophila]|jgi:antitoxin VapB|uniref:Antitoxin VapB n=1 Tax=Alpinimonas psychrophila TaxID=748908 RepID=A0A7W3JRV3_9MICO|nr:type II toxin-antitoxin system VapB family antitoxin [Alpinimonas psychrophila]MBA8828073.1 antitoxin VapB [Alpinimonas psychrophila]
MVSSKLFFNNTTQAVRLPKDVAFPSNVAEVDIILQGDARILVPKGTGWQWWAQHGPRLPEDFNLHREEFPPEKEPSDWFSK